MTWAMAWKTATSVPGFWRSQSVAKSVMPIWRGSMTMSLAPFWRTALEEVGDDGMGFGGIGAGDDEGVQVFHLGDGVGHGAGADGELQAGDGTGVAEAGAVVDVVGVQQGADEFLEDVGVFVGGFGAGVGGDRIAAVF
jgi:hypothetical protein